ncbi:MAG TPA: cytochrome c [Methylomirabilota bacterium]|nr:cytochrome c [Methylomirabilota bacterium]
MRGGGVRLRNILLAASVAVTAAGCVVGSQRMIGTGDLIFDRQRLGRVQEEQLGEIRSKFKTGNIEGIAANAEVIAITALQIPSLFPEGSLNGKSRAKPEIWQRWSEFEASAKNLTIWSERLRDAAKAKDDRVVADIVKDFGRVGCDSCHILFRRPAGS